MLRKIVITDAPDLSSDNFEEYLASDDLLVHYFNEFLSFLVFSEGIKYNKDAGVFEVVSDAADSLSKRIRCALLEYKSKSLAEHSKLSSSQIIDNSYTVLCLDREQGVQWIKKERLPLFLHSDCYFEYRLGKLLSQVDQILHVDPNYRSALVQDENEGHMRLLHVSHGQVSNISEPIKDPRVSLLGKTIPTNSLC